MKRDRDAGRDDEAAAEPWIYHLATAAELRAGCTSTRYAPQRLPQDGFVHCAGTPAVTLAVAADYFSRQDDDVYVLRVDPEKLSAPLRFEAPAPIEGGGRGHLAAAPHFPHVYGPIDRDAVVDVGRLERTGPDFAWPLRFASLDATLATLGP